jgi:predicted ester cyclase
VTLRGTHKGEFMGIAPTGKQIAIEMVDIVRVSGGKIAERWGIEGNLGMMQQLSVAGPPWQAGE